MTFTTQQTDNHFTINLRLKGIPAIIALVLILIGPLWLSHYWYARAAADIDGARQRLQLELDSERIRAILPNDYNSADKKQLREMGRQLTEPGYVIEDLQLRGTLFKRIIARVEFTMNGQPSVRYYRMRHSILMGWAAVPYRASELEWNLALWR